MSGRRLADQPGPVREQASDSDVLDVPVAVASGSQLRDVTDDGIVEPQLAKVAELQDGQGSEGLGDRRDPEQGRLVDWSRSREVGVAEAGGPFERLVADDPDGYARHTLLLRDPANAIREGRDDRLN